MRRALLVALLALSGCGGGDGALRVSAASSLKAAFTEIAPDAHFSFAGSDELAAQIRQGARPDVFAAANMELPRALAAEGLVEEPEAFATNRLVLAVPAGSDRVRSLDDLARSGVRLAIGAAGVPVGRYAAQVLERLPAAVAGNVRTREPDVAGIVGKLAAGAIDAGFVYATDVRAAGGRLDAIELPAELRPRVAYGIAVVKGAGDAQAAREFVARVRGARELREAGFGAP